MFQQVADGETTVRDSDDGIEADDEHAGSFLTGHWACPFALKTVSVIDPERLEKKSCPLSALEISSVFTMSEASNRLAVGRAGLEG